MTEIKYEVPKKGDGIFNKEISILDFQCVCGNIFDHKYCLISEGKGIPDSFIIFSCPECFRRYSVKITLAR